MAMTSACSSRPAETIRTIDQIIIDVQNGSLDYREAIRLAKAQLRAAELRGERKRKRGNRS
jgi:hypothetical protein